MQANRLIRPEMWGHKTCFYTPFKERAMLIAEWNSAKESTVWCYSASCQSSAEPTGAWRLNWKFNSKVPPDRENRNAVRDRRKSNRMSTVRLADRTACESHDGTRRIHLSTCSSFAVHLWKCLSLFKKTRIWQTRFCRPTLVLALVWRAR